MDEQTVITKHRRKPFLAAFLSFISIGLGYVYCGRIVKGLVLMFLAFAILLFSAAILKNLSRINMAVIGISSLVTLAIWLTAIIDSYRTAKHSGPDYQLKEYNRWYVYVIFILAASEGADQIHSNIRSNLIEAFRVSPSGMFPTFEYHDRFVANKNTYKNVAPKRGDVIVFISPENRREDYVKRVVAIPGDTVEMKDNQLFINGAKLEKQSRGRTSYIGKDPNEKEVKVEGELFIEKNGQAEYTIFLADTYNSKVFPDDHRADFSEKKVPMNRCFVLGDNRNLSADSRHFGSIPLATVKGRAEYLYWPASDWSRFGSIK